MFFCFTNKNQKDYFNLIRSNGSSFEKNSKFVLDRVGSHVEGIFFGTIQDLCDGDNRYSTIIHNLARFEYIIWYSENL